MDIKILSSLGCVLDRNNVLIIGTHNGIFHSDEVLASAILCLINSDVPVYILRTRSEEMLSLCDILVDVGGKDFDHHQAGFNNARKNGILYASSGLVWEKYGKQLINLILKKYFSNVPELNVCSIFQKFDSSFIALVDSEDNGIITETHCFSFIPTFLPLWFNNSAENFNNQFYKALTVTIAILEQELKTIIGKEIAKNTIVSHWNNKKYFNNGILEIPSQTIDWVETVITLNNSTPSDQINFVIFPYPSGGWAAQCVPPSLSNKFGQRVSFPLEWAGQTTKLPEISHVEGATFCHNGRFFVRATTKEAIIQLCNIATSSAS